MDELRRIRHLRGMSQEDLAKTSGVSDFTISELESGKRPNPRPSTLRKLAAALGVEVAALYGEEVPGPKDFRPRSLEDLLKREGVETRWLTLPKDEFRRWWLNVSREEAIRRYWEIHAEWEVIIAEERAARRGTSTAAPELQEWLLENWQQLLRRKLGATFNAPGKDEPEEEFYERQRQALGRPMRDEDLEKEAPELVAAGAGSE